GCVAVWTGVVAFHQTVLWGASVVRIGVGSRPVRRWTSPETAAQRCPRIDANIVEYAYIHHGSSPAAAISRQCSPGVMLTYLSGVPHSRVPAAAMASRPRDWEPVMSWRRPLAGAKASAARHRATSLRETSDIRPSAAGSRSWPLARARARNSRKNSL